VGRPGPRRRRVHRLFGGEPAGGIWAARQPLVRLAKETQRDQGARAARRTPGRNPPLGPDGGRSWW
jgi:hypothetical protein